MHTNAMEETSDRSDMKTLVCVHGQKKKKCDLLDWLLEDVYNKSDIKAAYK